jgi:hypothetical protein
MLNQRKQLDYWPLENRELTTKHPLPREQQTPKPPECDVLLRQDITILWIVNVRSSIMRGTVRREYRRYVKDMVKRELNKL